MSLKVKLKTIYLYKLIKKRGIFLIMAYSNIFYGVIVSKKNKWHERIL